MSVQIGCFPETIIGLTRNTCECFDIDDTASESGLYIDEGEGMNLKTIDAVPECETGTLQEFMQWAREEAIKNTKGEIMKAIAASQRVKTRIPNWSGYIGDRDFTKTLQVNKDLAGIRTIMNPLRGGIMRVKGIGVAFSNNVTFNIGLYDNVDSASLEVIEVTSQVNSLKWKVLSTPLNLSMYDKGKPLEYFWLYAVNQNNLPKDGAVHCGCGSTPSWTYPQYAFDVSQDRYNWSQWAMVAGVEGMDIDERMFFPSSTAKNYGIVLDVDFICNVYETLCRESHDFENDSAAYDLANTIRHRACELLLGKILLTNEISVYTSQSAEVTAQIAGQHRADWLNGIQSLVDYFTMPEHVNEHADCYECKNSSGFRRGRILS